MRTRKMMLYAGMIASLTMGIFISGAGQQKVEAKTKVTYTLKKGTLTIKGKGATFAEPIGAHSSQPSEEEWEEAIKVAEERLAAVRAQ